MLLCKLCHKLLFTRVFFSCGPKWEMKSSSTWLRCRPGICTKATQTNMKEFFFLRDSNQSRKGLLGLGMTSTWKLYFGNHAIYHKRLKHRQSLKTYRRIMSNKTSVSLYMRGTEVQSSAHNKPQSDTRHTIWQRIMKIGDDNSCCCNLHLQIHAPNSHDREKVWGDEWWCVGLSGCEVTFIRKGIWDFHHVAQL